MSPSICPHCGSTNTVGASHCQSCGKFLSLSSPLPAEEAREKPRGCSPFRHLKESFNKVAMRSKENPAQAPRSHSAPAPPPRATQPMQAQNSYQSAPSNVYQPVNSERRPTPSPLSAHQLFNQGRYLILTPRRLERTYYYDALDLRCPHCQTNYTQKPPNALCQQCGQPLQTVLIHEHHRPIQQGLRSQMLQMGTAGHPKILHHLDILTFTHATFTILQHPGVWGVVVRGRRPRPRDNALAIVVQVAQVFTYLHQRGFTYPLDGESSLLLALETILTLSGNEARIADLSLIQPLPVVKQAQNQAIANDIAFLGQLLLYLSSNITHLPGSLDQASNTIHPVIAGALQQRYPNVAAFIQALHEFPARPPAPKRPLKPIHGQATHPGQHHQHNEDAIVTFTYNKEQSGQSVPIGFYLVADGMGGYEAGDLASRTVNQIVTDWVLQTKILPDLRKTTRKLTEDNITEELLQEAIQQANQVLLQRAKAQSSDMGSTVTAALIIGNAVTVVNVGDSRTYLLREGQIQQVTQDHSLVARLVEANVITPEEVRQHPRRNEIYRSLGQDAEIEVDTFTFALKRGDRLILCCDGLWEMVEDAQIQQIAEAAKTPQQACDTLIQAANQAGGEDNISVIVIAME